MDKVRDDGFDQGTPDEEVFREAFLSDALEASADLLREVGKGRASAFFAEFSCSRMQSHAVAGKAAHHPAATPGNKCHVPLLHG